MIKVSTLHARKNLVAFLALLCGLSLFLPNIASPFLSDDFVLLSWTHPSSLQDLPQLFDPNTFWFYRPIVKLLYWLNQIVFGLHTVPLHILSLIGHCANGYLVYLLVVRQAGSTWVAGLLSGLLFLINFHHAETVSWIVAIGDIVGASCILLSLHSFQAFCEKGRYSYLVASLASFAIGLFTRETVVLLPALLLLYLLIFRRNAELRSWRFLLSLGTYAVILLGYLFVQSTISTTQASTVRGGLQFHALNLESILLAIMDYLHGLTPAGAIFTQLPLSAHKALVWLEWTALALLAGILWRFKRPVMLFGLGWLLITPIVFIFFSAPTDRYFYLPSIGYAILTGNLLASWSEVVIKKPSSILTAPILTALNRAAAVLVMLTLLLMQSVSLASRELDWKTASQASGGVLQDIQAAAPNPRDYMAFYFVDLPISRNGVPVFQNGLQEAVQLTYDNKTLAAFSRTCDSLQREAELPRYSVFFRYTEKGARQFFNQKTCR